MAGRTLHALFGLSTLFSLNVHAGSHKQQPLQPVDHTDGPLSIIYELTKAEIIPTVLDKFEPEFSLGVEWSSKHKASLGNTIKPKKLHNEPIISLSPFPTAVVPQLCASNMTFVVTMTDPDAPSRDDPQWSEMAHWAASGISGAALTSSGCVVETSNLKDILPYKPPGPPKKTGKHRYVITVFAPLNSTSAPLNLTKPTERKHWGYGKERSGVRNWSTENGLTPIAANFVYSQHKKQ